ncbi:MAG: dTDP-4-dehydrorhamnose reductase [Bdellovibrio sp.]|nr:MAG: dTDP-4-dehydrorhamnose reductase [Bdellovibrio sp.]
MNKILILGSSGQVGYYLTEILGSEAIPLSRDEAPLNNIEQLQKILSSYTPKAIINAAAYTLVDQAENEKEKAFMINATAPGILAQYCKTNDIPFVHFSTDYVFDGKKKQPYHEEDTPHPLNTYGKSKLAGEKEVLEKGNKYLIFRTSWVYSLRRKNFLKTILQKVWKKEPLKIVNDQIGTPNWAFDIANISIQCLNQALQFNKFPKGIYHLSSQGETSWFGFTEKILSLLHQENYPLYPISTQELAPKVQRPFYSVLGTQLIQKTFQIELPSWQESLKKALSPINLGDLKNGS